MMDFTYERRLLVDNTSRRPCKRCHRVHPFFSKLRVGDTRCGRPVLMPDDADEGGPTISGGFFVSARRLSVLLRLWLHGWRVRDCTTMTSEYEASYVNQETASAG